jgi:quercetin dioxygenase-like cupin family protein
MCSARLRLRERTTCLAAALYAAAGMCVALSVIVASSNPSVGLLSIAQLYASICQSAPAILNMTAVDGARPKSIVSIVSQEDIGDGRMLTVQRVQYPPRGFTPKHVHGGVVQAYVTKGVLRSHVSGQEPGEFAVGGTFHETYGATHYFVENPSSTEWAELLAIQVHRKDEALTTFVE